MGGPGQASGPGGWGELVSCPVVFPPGRRPRVQRGPGGPAGIGRPPRRGRDAGSQGSLITRSNRNSRSGQNSCALVPGRPSLPSVRVSLVPPAPNQQAILPPPPTEAPVTLHVVPTPAGSGSQPSSAQCPDSLQCVESPSFSGAQDRPPSALPHALEERLPFPSLEEGILTRPPDPPGGGPSARRAGGQAGGS